MLRWSRLAQPAILSKALSAAALGAGEAVGGRPEPSADLLRELDDDPLGQKLTRPCIRSPKGHAVLHHQTQIRCLAQWAGIGGLAEQIG